MAIPTGYDLKDRLLVINQAEAERVREIYQLYLKLGCVSRLQHHLNAAGMRTKLRVSRAGNTSGGAVYSRGGLYKILSNRIYLGEVTNKGKSYPGQQDPIIDRKLWDEVQASFEYNLQARMRRPRTTSQSLLTGLLYDEKGNRFTPSHSSKKGRRYRYYVSQAVIRKKTDTKGITRLPAQEMEDLVVSRLQALLGSPQRLLNLMGQISDPRETESIVKASREWAKDVTSRFSHSFSSSTRTTLPSRHILAYYSSCGRQCRSEVSRQRRDHLGNPQRCARRSDLPAKRKYFV